MKVLIADGVDKPCGELLRQNGFDVTEKPKLTKDELKAIVADFDVLIVRSATKVTADILDLAPKMKLIGRAGAGVDNIDLAASTRKGVIVMNTPGGNTISTAEHTCAMIMSAARLIPHAHGELKQNIWDKKKWMGAELEGKTLAIIGLGKIGREVAKRMQAFSMKTIAYDPMISADIAGKFDIEMHTLEDCFKLADFITVHTPLNEATKNIIRTETIATMKKGVRIINCARGGIINETDLAAAITSGHVAAAAFDVFTEEPPPPEHPLVKSDRVVLTPHIAASTVEAQEKVAVQIAEQIVGWKTSGTLAGAVNASAVELAQMPEVKAYLTLAEKLGSMHAQMSGKASKLTVISSGDFLQKFSEAITAATVKGVLSVLVKTETNYINAVAMAKDLGIEVKEVREKENPDYTSLIRVEYETQNGKRLIGGIVLGAKDVRVVMMDKFICEFKPEGNTLIYTNDDKPGVLATVGAKLLRGNLNIANLSLVRDEEKKQALTIITMDSDLDESLVADISKVDGVREARLVRL